LRASERSDPKGARPKLQNKRKLEQIKEGIALFEQWAKSACTKVEQLAMSGSERKYYRLSSALNTTALAVYNPYVRENEAFVAYTNFFRAQNLPLPEVYLTSLESGCYLVEDLGDTTLFEELQKNGYTDSIDRSYKQALEVLAKMQFVGAEGLPVEQYQTPAQFDEQSMTWDLNYFKYCFLKASKVDFDEYLLEQDFKKLVSFLSDCEMGYFMFRDFQARNIMLRDNQAYFIDYQGGKYGPLQYDVVSLLFQAKANLPNETRQLLLEYYLEAVQEYAPIDKAVFKQKYYAFVLMRTLQVLGAYGFRGYLERKEHFLTSIPFAIQNLKWWLENVDLPIELDYLYKVLDKLVCVEEEKAAKQQQTSTQLTVRVQSFSYKRGLPEDPSGNGGGFVFDCRFIHNPGRYTPYKRLTGRDQPVIDFFKASSTIDAFVETAEKIVLEAVANYTERNFAHLAINFGCTGGQHRSVYSADAIAKSIKEKFPTANVVLWHREQERKNWMN
jgi:aminoglycoside/choline kinase family phosphotransferase